MEPLKIAVGEYGLTWALKRAPAESTGLAFEWIEVEPITAAMRRMVRALEFDVCEMAVATYLCARAQGKPISGIPVFVTRNFHHRAAVRRVGSGVETPKDLEGRKVGVVRGYTVTTGLWARGILASEYGVDLDAVAWAATDDEHVLEYRPPSHVDYGFRGRSVEELLLAGEIDAAVGDVRSRSDRIAPLIPDPQAAGAAWFRKTGIYPLNHMVVVKDGVLERRPEIAAQLFRAFQASKEAYLVQLRAGDDLSPEDEAVNALGAVVGDPFLFGVEANRKALDAVIGFAVDQGISPAAVEAEELFAEAARGLA